MKKCIFVVLVSGVLGFANQGETMQVIEKAGSLGSFKGDSKIFSGDVQVYMMFKANVFRDFSDKKINDIDEKLIASEITKDDMLKVSRQLKVSMGSMFVMVEVFAVILYMLLIYLLCKLIIEKNTTSISMIKILGYENTEVSKLYIVSNTIVVVLSTLINIPLSSKIVESIYVIMMKDFSGWLNYYVNPITYLKMFILGIASYIVVALFEYRKISKIPMTEALKTVE